MSRKELIEALKGSIISMDSKGNVTVEFIREYPEFMDKWDELSTPEQFDILAGVFISKIRTLHFK
jgi:hypothetical protein